VFLVGLGAINTVGVLAAFRDSIRMIPRTLPTSEGNHTPGRSLQAFSGMVKTLQLRVVWILSLFFFFHLGAGITAGGRSNLPNL
jgi:hypothetical protein